MKHLIVLLVAAVIGLPISNAQTFQAKGKDFGASDISYAVVPATPSRPVVEFISLYTDKDDPLLKFYSSGPAITLPSGEGVAGTCAVLNADYALTNDDIVVSHDAAQDVFERHKILYAGTNYVVLDPAPSGTLATNDRVYEATLDISLTLSAAYGPTPTNGAAVRIPHMTLGGGPLYSGRPDRPLLVDFVGTTNDGAGACNLDYVSGTRR